MPFPNSDSDGLSSDFKSLRSPQQRIQLSVLHNEPQAQLTDKTGTDTRRQASP